MDGQQFDSQRGGYGLEARSHLIANRDRERNGKKKKKGRNTEEQKEERPGCFPQSQLEKSPSRHSYAGGDFNLPKLFYFIFHQGKPMDVYTLEKQG